MGFLGSLGESFRAHLDERVRSPFAGAFFVAWIAVNWKPILILAISSKPIEERVSFVSKSYLSIADTVWYPLALAAVFAVGFYLASALFSVLAEIYSSVESLISRAFDRIRWVSPATYIDQKKSLNDKIAGLQELASDNLRLLEIEKENTRKIQEELISNQKKLNDAASEIAEKNSEISSLRNDLNESFSIKDNAEMSAKYAHDYLSRVSDYMLDSSTKLGAILDNSKAGVHGEFISMDKETLIYLRDQFERIRSKIASDLSDFNSRENRGSTRGRKA